jgi:hypothetical protein
MTLAREAGDSGMNNQCRLVRLNLAFARSAGLIGGLRPTWGSRPRLYAFAGLPSTNLGRLSLKATLKQWKPRLEQWNSQLKW